MNAEETRALLGYYAGFKFENLNDAKAQGKIILRLKERGVIK